MAAHIKCVSVMTIRRDLLQLEEQGFLTVHRGVAYLNTGTTLELSSAIKNSQMLKEKKRIARQALQFIFEGATVYLDIGTTVRELAYEIVQKYGSTRKVPVPRSAQAALDTMRTLAGNPGPDAFVISDPALPDKPLSTKYFQRALQKELDAIGIPGKEQNGRNLTFHGLRHTYITLGRLAGISDLEIQALAGHKSGAMMDRYSHASQVLDFAAAREKLETALNAGAIGG